MPKQRLSAKFVESVKAPPVGQVDYFDATLPAFGLRVSKDGAKSWFCFYRVDGKQVRQTLGRFPTLSLADARTAAGAVFDAVEAGHDPRLEHRRQRAAAARERANTVRAIADKYLASIGASDARAAPVEAEKSKGRQRGRRKKGTTLRSAREIKRTLEKYILPAIGERPIADLKRRELIDLFDAIADNHGGIMANRALAWTRRLFNWSISRDYIDASPCVGIEPPAEEIERKRELSPEEIREVWAACDALGYPGGRLVQWLFATACRRGEGARMARGEIDAVGNVWVVPAARQKSKVDHAIPLSDLALRILEDLPEFTGSHLFTTTGGKKAVGAFGDMKKELDRLILEARQKDAAAAGADPAKVVPMPHWVMHDARRAFRSALSEAGIDTEIADFCLGHVPEKLRRTYDRFSYLPQKKRAFDLWGVRLEEIIGPSSAAKIVRLRRA
jgi:integrase